MPDFVLPDLGEGLTEAQVIAWHVDVGDEVAIDQIVVEVETAKAVVEVPIPFAGTVSDLHARAGEMVDVGAALITVTGLGQAGASGGFREPGIVTAADEGSGNVLIGYGTPQVVARRRGARSSRRRAESGAPDRAAVPEHGVGVAVVSPIVRRMARESAVDLASVSGTGPAGLVMRRDVEQVLAARGAPEAPDAPDAPDRTRMVDGAHADRTRRIPLTGPRKTLADKLSRSRREIPEATVWVEVDATALLAARSELNRRDPDRPVGLLALLARYTVAGLKLFPELNGRVEADEIVLQTAVHLGFAAQTERGLVVPVVRYANRLSTRELSAAMTAHTASARAGSLSPSELSGGTFTVNNYGVFGVDGSAAIINHPEVAILGIGRIIDKPWVVDGELAVRKVTQLTLAFDHRVCDGGTAGGFLRFVADCVEAPTVALGEL